MKISGKEVKTNLTYARLKECLSYNKINGVFRWKKFHSGISCGSTAGNISHGYIRISVDQISYQAHRLAWLYVYGEWPTTDIDHINGKREDNRISNLRLATRSQNLANSRVRRNGLKGVYYSKRNKKWCARVQKNGKVVYIAYFNTEREAHNAYCIAAKKIHGEFARAA